MLSVLSYNILYGKKLPQIAEWINGFSAPFDILCFQEFPKDKINFMLKFLKFANNSFKYATNFIKDKKDYGELTLINTKKIKFLDSKAVFLGNNFIEEKIFGLKGERSSLITKLKINNKTFILANTHLIAYALNSHRRSQLLTVTEHVDSFFAAKKHPVVLLGDLNYSSLIWQHGIFKIMERKGFKNSHKEETHKLLSLKYQQLDYVFSRHCTISEIEVLKLPFSDHLPIMFKLQI